MPSTNMIQLGWQYPLQGCCVTEQVTRIQARPKRVGEQRTRAAHRKLRLELYELEPESGKDESVHVDLNLDQLED